MARCWWQAASAGAASSPYGPRPSCSTRTARPGPPPGAWPRPATIPWPRCCPMARCWWRAASIKRGVPRVRLAAAASSHWPQPSCTTPAAAPSRPNPHSARFAPADLPKGGSSVDLAIAVGILLGSEQFSTAGGRTALIGELSLGSEVRPVPGLLPMLGALDAPEPDGFIVLGILIPQNATPSARTGDQARRSRGVDEVRSAASRHVVRVMTATAGAPERLHWYTLQS